MSNLETMRDTTRAKYIESFKKSWTFAKLTDTEKSSCIKMLSNFPLNSATTQHQANNIMLSAYHAFLCGAGYDDDTSWANWRETKNDCR